jgi:Domain of unknown function (DUF4384)
MSVPPGQDDRDRTVIMPAPPVEAVARPGRRKRPSVLLILAWLALVAAISAGALFFLRERKLTAVPAQHPPPAPAQQATPQLVPPAPAPPPRAPEKAFSPHQMLAQIFEGRNRGHSVTASADGGAVHIGSSRPGYVYVLAAGADQSVLFVAVFFPSAADTNNRIRPGQTLKLPGSQWPTNTEFLAIVSDEPRDFTAMGSIAGKVVCSAAAPCSESYGAVAFSSGAVRGRDAARAPAAAAPAPAAAPKAPAARPTGAALKRCSDILERASLGEVLTAEEHTFLRRECR